MGMFIKFLQSSLYFSALPPFRTVELELDAKTRRSLCVFFFTLTVGSTVQWEVSCIFCPFSVVL